MFEFSDVKDLADSTIRKLLTKIPNTDLVYALQDAGPDCKKGIFANMSKRFAAFLEDDVENFSPVPLETIEDAQQGIANALNAIHAQEPEEIVWQRNLYDINTTPNLPGFDVIKNLDDRSIRELLTTIPIEYFTTALRGADAATQKRVFDNLSEFAVKMIQEDISSLDPVLIEDFKTAQQQVIDTVEKILNPDPITLTYEDVVSLYSAYYPEET